MTKFLSRIEVKVEGDIVRARLFDRDAVTEVAMCRKTAIAAAMDLFNQMDPDTGEGAIVPMIRRAVTG